jgi:hypothetical protein
VTSEKAATRTQYRMTPAQVLYRRAMATPDGVAFTAEQSKRLARSLAGHCVRQGDDVALHLPGAPNWSLDIPRALISVLSQSNYRWKIAEPMSILERA